MTIPKAKMAWIGGSGSWGMETKFFPEVAPEITSIEDLPPIETEFGESAPFHLLTISGEPVLHFTMHGWHPEKMLPTEECSLQVAEVLRLAGVEVTLTDASVGGIAHPVTGTLLPPNTAVIPHDYIRYYQPRNFPPPVPGAKGRTVRMGEPLCAGVRKHLLDSVSDDLWFNVAPYGIYGFIVGPFETGAEIQRMKRDGCHVVGQTLYPEAALLRQRGIHFGSLNIVSNYAEGVCDHWVGDDMPGDMARFYKDECPPHCVRAMVSTITKLVSHGIGQCNCEEYVLEGMDQFPADYH